MQIEKSKISAYSSLIRLSYEEEEFDETCFNLLGIAMPSELQKANRKRKVQFCFGRYAAKLALMECGFTEPFEIIKHANGSPLWPDGFNGSLTHSDNFAACVVTKDPEVLALGIDAEPFIADKVLPHIKKIVALQQETDLGISLNTTLSKTQFYTLLFSAKESIFKCLNGITGSFIEFKDLAIIDVSPARGEFTFELMRDISPLWRKNKVITGNYSLDETRVNTRMNLTKISMS